MAAELDFADKAVLFISAQLKINFNQSSLSVSLQNENRWKIQIEPLVKQWTVNRLKNQMLKMTKFCPQISRA